MVFELVLDLFKDPIAARGERRDHDVIGGDQFGKRSMVANDM